MSDNKKGIVGKISVKDMGRYKLHSFTLKGQDGWYSAGFSALPFTEGEAIEFGTAKNAKGYDEVDRSSIRKLVGQEALAAIPVAETVKNGGGFRKSGPGFVDRGQSDAKEGYWAEKAVRDIQVQKRIEIQSCRNSALALVEILFKPEISAIKLPAKESARETIVVEMVKKYTADFLAENSQGHTAETTDTVAEDAETPADKPKADFDATWN